MVRLPCSGTATGDRGGVELCQAMPRRFHTEDFHGGIVEEGTKQSHRIGAAANAGARCEIPQGALDFLHLRAGLDAHNGLEVAHHHRMDRGPATVPMQRNVLCTLVTQSRSASFIASFSARRTERHDLARQHFHVDHVGLLPLDVDRAHIDHAFEPEPRA